MIDNGATPLLVASQRGHADVTQLLCRVPLQSAQRQHQGIKNRHLKAVMQDIEVATMILESTDV